MTISTLLIALIILLIIILVVFLYYKKQQPPKKVCKVDKDCGSGEHCVRGSCSSLSCLDAVKMDKRNIKIDSKISSCEFTPNFYRFTDTAADEQQEFGKTRHPIKITPSPSESHSPQRCVKNIVHGEPMTVQVGNMLVMKRREHVMYIIIHITRFLNMVRITS
ncbi:p22 [African swine fever virus]|nr:p22 [African swine fever virus]